MEQLSDLDRLWSLLIPWIGQMGGADPVVSQGRRRVYLRLSKEEFGLALYWFGQAQLKYTYSLVERSFEHEAAAYKAWKWYNCSEPQMGIQRVQIIPNIELPKFQPYEYLGVRR